MINLSKEHIQKLSPFYQIAIAAGLSVIGIIFSKIGLLGGKNDWYIIFFGLLCFMLANPFIGLVQTQVLKYLGYSLVSLLIFLLVFLFAGKFGLISRFSEDPLNQSLFFICLFFYVILNVVAVLIRTILKLLQES